MSLEQCSEFTYWKYFCRQVQVKAITQEAVKLCNSEAHINNRNLSCLYALLYAPPIFRNSLIDQSGMDEKEFYQNALMAVSIQAKMDKVKNCFDDLCQGTSVEQEGFGLVYLDRSIFPIELPSGYAQVFKDKHDELIKLIEFGEEEGIKVILDLLSSEAFPLMRLKVTLAIQLAKQKKMELNPRAISSGSIGYLPTKIERLFLLLAYTKGEMYPELSLQIRPLS